MRRRVLRKNEVLREGYINGLRKAQRIINEMLREEQLEDAETTAKNLVDNSLERLRDYCEQEGDDFESYTLEDLMDAVYEDFMDNYDGPGKSYSDTEMGRKKWKDIEWLVREELRKKMS